MKPATTTPSSDESRSSLKRNLLLLASYLAILTLIARVYL